MADDHVRVRVNVIVGVGGIWIVDLAGVHLGQHVDVLEHTRLFIESEFSGFSLLVFEKKFLWLYLRSIRNTCLLSRHLIIVIKLHFKRELLNKWIVEFVFLRVIFLGFSGSAFENSVMDGCVLHFLVLLLVIFGLFKSLDLQLRSPFIALRISA